MTATVAITAIDLYQQFISPYKGFRCAHRACHGRTSCSQFAKRLIAKVGLLRFVPLLMGRLKRCGNAARAWKANAAERRRRSAVQAQRDADDRKRRKSSWLDGCDVSGCDAGGCGDAGVSGVGDCASGCDFSI